jgi:hypothetical protein
MLIEAHHDAEKGIESNWNQIAALHWQVSSRLLI